MTRPQLQKAAKGFEAILAKQLIETMQCGTKLFGEGAGSGIYQDFFNQAVADSFAQRGTFGIAKMIEQQMEPRLAAIDQSNISGENQGNKQ